MHGNVCGNLSRKSSAQPALPDSQPRTTPSLTFAALAIFSTDIPMAGRETAISWRQNFPQPGRMGQLRQRIHRRLGDVIEMSLVGCDKSVELFSVIRIFPESEYGPQLAGIAADFLVRFPAETFGYSHSCRLWLEIKIIWESGIEFLKVRQKGRKEMP